MYNYIQSYSNSFSYSNRISYSTRIELFYGSLTGWARNKIFMSNDL